MDIHAIYRLSVILLGSGFENWGYRYAGQPTSAAGKPCYARGSNLYFSTLRPPFFSVLGLLFPLDDGLAPGAVFGAISSWDERLSASGAVAKLVAVKDVYLQGAGRDDLHQNET